GAGRRRGARRHRRPCRPAGAAVTTAVHAVSWTTSRRAGGGGVPPPPARGAGERGPPGLPRARPRGRAVAAYSRSLFLNVTLPGGVVGDVHRGISHGRDTSDVGRGLRAGAWGGPAGL